MLPLTIDYEFVKKLESENKRLKENEKQLNIRIKDAYTRAWESDEKLQLFHLLFSYLIHTGSLQTNTYYKIFPGLFDRYNKFFDDVLRDAGRYTLEKDFQGFRVVDKWQR